jgi:hypothetical protein
LYGFVHIALFSGRSTILALNNHWLLGQLRTAKVS